MKLKPKLIVGERPKGNIWFMSDLHYGHFNSIRHSSRPFTTLEELNNYIREELRTKLSPNDYLFDLGDLFWKTDYEEVGRVLDCIPCPLVKILGNHDNENIWYKFPSAQKKTVVTDRVDVCIKDGDRDYKLVLDHYPILSWNGRHHGSWNIHGHCHGGVDELNKSSMERRLDVGFDSQVAKEVGSFLIPWKIIKDKLTKLDYNEIEIL